MSNKERILKVAEDLFVEKGFIGTSMNEIAEKAGVAKSLIYHHFDSKKALWTEMIRNYHEKSGVLEKFCETMSRRDPEILLGLATGQNSFFEFLRTNPRLVRLFTWLNLEREFDPEYPDEDMRKRVLEMIRELQQEGLVRRDIDVGLIPIIFMSIMIHWFSARWSLVRWLGTDATEEELDQTFIHGVMDILLKGIQPDAKA